MWGQPPEDNGAVTQLSWPLWETLRNMAAQSRNFEKLTMRQQLSASTVLFMVKARESQDVDTFTAMESLRAALDRSGIVLPSLGVDPASPDLGLVELGCVRADVAWRLAHALRRGDPAA